jgi:hypothetical protein
MSGIIIWLPTCTGMMWTGINVEVVAVVVVAYVPYLHRRG